MKWLPAVILPFLGQDPLSQYVLDIESIKALL